MNVYCTPFHIKRAKTELRRRTTDLSVIASLGTKKLFNTKVRRGAIFTSKCTRNCLASSSASSLAGFKGYGPWKGKGKRKGERGRKRGKRGRRGVVPHLKQKSGCATASSSPLLPIYFVHYCLKMGLFQRPFHAVNTIKATYDTSDETKVPGVRELIQTWRHVASTLRHVSRSVDDLQNSRYEWRNIQLHQITTSVVNK